MIIAMPGCSSYTKTLIIHIKSILTRDRSPSGSAFVTMTKEKGINTIKISKRTSIKSHLMFFFVCFVLFKQENSLSLKVS